MFQLAFHACHFWPPSWQTFLRHAENLAEPGRSQPEERVQLFLCNISRALQVDTPSGRLRWTLVPVIGQPG